MTIILSALVAAPKASFCAKDTHKTPYIGFDIQKRKMAYRDGFGDNLLSKNSTQNNLYAGLRFLNWLAIEAGYESGHSKDRFVILPLGAIVAGTQLTAPVSPAEFLGRFKITSRHINLVGFCPLAENIPIEAFLSVGISNIRGRFERHTVMVNNIRRTRVRVFFAQKDILRVAGGVQYWINDYMALRTSVAWSKTGKIRAMANDGIFSVIPPSVKPKNTTVLGVGLLLAF